MAVFELLTDLSIGLSKGTNDEGKILRRQFMAKI